MTSTASRSLSIKALPTQTFNAGKNPHPTFTENIKEAALDATGKRALHM